MKRFLLLLLFVVNACHPQQANDRLVPLTILHWNDFHSYNIPYKVTVHDSLLKRDTTYFVGGTATLLGYINKFRQSEKHVAVFNAGDDYTGTPISALTNGRSQVELMNIIKPTAASLGNHEFDHGPESLKENLALVQHPLLCANVWDGKNKRFFATPSTVVNVGGIKLGLIGFVPPELPILVVWDTMTGLQMLDVDSILTLTIAEFKRERVDLIVIISHMGIAHDTLVAQKFRDVNVIVGGHDHFPFFAPIKKNRAVIVQAGSQGRWLGKLDLVVDVAGDSVYSYSGKLIETKVSDITPDPVAASKADELESLVRASMSEVIGELKAPWRRSRGESRAESNIGNWQADVMRGYAQTDIAFQNNGGIRADLPAGPITVGDVWRINPFGNQFVTFSIKGSMVRAMVEFQTRGNTREFVQVSGLRYVFDSSKPPGQRLISVEVNASPTDTVWRGKPLEDDRLYTAVTNNYVSSNFEAHFGVSLHSLQFQPLPEIDRDVFIGRIRKDKLISSAVEGRITDVAQKGN